MNLSDQQPEHASAPTRSSSEGPADSPYQSMTERAPVDIAIVGGGMIGAAMALRLSGLGWRLALLDGQPIGVGGPAETQSGAEPVYDARVSALTHASQRLFESLGVWQPMCEQRVGP